MQLRKTQTSIELENLMISVQNRKPINIGTFQICPESFDQSSPIKDFEK